MTTANTTKNFNAETVLHPRKVERVVPGVATSDGAGVRLTRVLTPNLQKRLDPFLMLDHFGTDNPGDYIGGFPDHPHRGFETVTYMIEGRMRHRDSAGNEGLLQNGGVQWMTAGRGLVHSELPEQEEGRMEGFQLWLNLPARDKMTTPGYRDIQSEAIPEVRLPSGVLVRVIAGGSHGVAGAMQRDTTEPLYLDLHFESAAEFSQSLARDMNAFIYVYRGEVQVQGYTVPAHRMAVLGNDKQADGVVLQSQGPARVLLVAGKPLNEPIAQHGPFVMNTHEELVQAVADFQAGKFHQPVAGA
ncbi:MAG: pirin family protein [Candidimonas sp.]|nr:pirin family protein [Candidimonas sp.]